MYIFCKNIFIQYTAKWEHWKNRINWIELKPSNLWLFRFFPQSFPLELFWNFRFSAPLRTKMNSGNLPEAEQQPSVGASKISVADPADVTGRHSGTVSDAELLSLAHRHLHLESLPAQPFQHGRWGTNSSSVTAHPACSCSASCLCNGWKMCIYLQLNMSFGGHLACEICSSPLSFCLIFMSIYRYTSIHVHSHIHKHTVSKMGYGPFLMFSRWFSGPTAEIYIFFFF